VSYEAYYQQSSRQAARNSVVLYTPNTACVNRSLGYLELQPIKSTASALAVAAKVYVTLAISSLSSGVADDSQSCWTANEERP
jgi:hypothetical protein